MRLCQCVHACLSALHTWLLFSFAWALSVGDSCYLLWSELQFLWNQIFYSPAPLCNASENTHRHTHPIYKAWLLQTWRACLSISYVFFFIVLLSLFFYFPYWKTSHHLVLWVQICSLHNYYLCTNLIHYKDSEQLLYSNWIEVYDFCRLCHYFTNCKKKKLLSAIGLTNRYSCPRAGISLLWLAYSGFCISIQEKIK